jgi:hypothetical protein
MLPKEGKNGPMLTLDNVSSVNNTYNVVKVQQIGLPIFTSVSFQKILFNAENYP